MERPCPPWLKRFDKASRLLLHALATGSSGALAAFRALQRGQAGEGPGQAFSWQAFTAALCSEEPTLEGLEKTLAVKPLLLLLPVVCQRNLFSLLHVVQAVVPRDCLSRLLQAVTRHPGVDPWVQTLGDLLRQGLREEERSLSPAALTDGCQQQLRCLCQKIAGNAQSKPEGQRRLNWCVSKGPTPTEDTAGSVFQDGKRKKASEEILELKEERHGKRLVLEEAGFDLYLPGPPEELPAESSGDRPAQSPVGSALESSKQDTAVEPSEARQSLQAELAAEVQTFLQMHGPRLKRLLQVESSHSELSIPPELRILNDCSPGQLEGLCSFLQLSTCPEHLLVRFCTWLLALTPDLSYTSAAILAEQLFLARVLALTQPPSRHLMAALASFCSKYAQPFCRVVVAPILQGPREGPEQTKLVCELVEECLEPEYVRLVLSQVLEVPLSERLLPVVQSVLGRQEVLPPELFDLLVHTLCQHAPAFATSLNYAKLVMAVLTLYQSHVTAAHRGRLSAALGQSNAALKKSLQAVLEEAPPR